MTLRETIKYINKNAFKLRVEVEIMSYFWSLLKTIKTISHTYINYHYFILNYFSGDVIRWEQQIRFRHLTTRQYLCITTDRRVTLTSDSKDPRTVFRLHSVIKVSWKTMLLH